MEKQGYPYPTEQQPQAPPNYDYGAPPPYFHEQHGMHAMPQPPPPGFVATETTTVITTQPITTTTHQGLVAYVLPQTHNSCRLQCPYCHADVSTATTYESGMMAHLFAIILCCFVCWPCVCLPYCMDGCKDTSHECPACKRHLGVVKRL